MKVTVCFHSVRVVVPCGDGRLLVRDLMDEAKARYAKAVKKAENTWITIHSLKSSDGGILDPDDPLGDVVDDREQISADFFEAACPLRLQSGADGTSGTSSTGTASPDSFANVSSNKPHYSGKSGVCDSSPSKTFPGPLQSHPMASRRRPLKEKKVTYKNDCSLATESDWKMPFDSFLRSTSARKSINGVAMQLTESQDRVELADEEVISRGPLNCDLSGMHKEWNDAEFSSSTERRSENLQDHGLNLRSPSTKQVKFIPIVNTRTMGKIIEMDLVKGVNGLGFSVTTRDNFAGCDSPIYVKNVLPHGAAIQDGRLQPGDRLLEVNGVEMSGKSQMEVSSLLRNLGSGQAVHLVVSRQMTEDDNEVAIKEDESGNNRSYMENAVSLLEVGRGHSENDVEPDEDGGHCKDIQSRGGHRATEDSLPVKDETGKLEAKRNAQVEGKRFQRLSVTFSGRDQKRNSLGISIKGKTFVTETEMKDIGLFVKSIVPGGVAAKDGQLRPDDLLVEINGSSLTECTNVEAMMTLRNVLHRCTNRPIELVVLRPLDIPSRYENSWTFPDVISDHEKSDTWVTVVESTSGRLPVTVERNRTVPAEETLLLSKACEGEYGLTKPSDQSISSSESGNESSDALLKTDYCHALTACDEVEGMVTDMKNVVGKNFQARDGKQDADDLDSAICDWDSEHGQEGMFSRDGIGRQSVSEKRKACIDPRSFAVYRQIKTGKCENDCNSMRRALSVESISRKLFSPLKSDHSAKENRLKRCNSTESIQSPPRGQRASHRFRDTLGHCYLSQSIRGDSPSSESSNTLSNHKSVAERKNKVLHGISSVFRFRKMKVKWNCSQRKEENAADSRCGEEDEAKRTPNGSQGGENLPLAEPVPQERLLDTRKSSKESRIQSFTTDEMNDGMLIGNDETMEGRHPLPSCSLAERYGWPASAGFSQVHSKALLPHCHCSAGRNSGGTFPLQPFHWYSKCMCGLNCHQQHHCVQSYGHHQDADDFQSTFSHPNQSCFPFINPHIYGDIQNDCSGGGNTGSSQPGISHCPCCSIANDVSEFHHNRLQYC